MSAFLIIPIILRQEGKCAAVIRLLIFTEEKAEHRGSGSLAKHVLYVHELTA